jgi:hypothetical protein
MKAVACVGRVGDVTPKKEVFWIQSKPLDGLVAVALHKAFDLPFKSCHNRRLRN